MIITYWGAEDDDGRLEADERADIEDEIAARRADEAKEHDHDYEIVRVCTRCGGAMA